MRKLVLMCVMFLLSLSACGGMQGKAWTKLGITQEQFQQDNAQCYMWSRQVGATAASGMGSSYNSMGGAMGSGFAAGLMEGITQVEEYKKCMQLKGYHLVDKETGESE